jgi:hypothetical protein
MSKRLTQVMVLLVTCALISADALAAAAAATLHGNGGVSVNGNAVTPTSTVFGGDRIETAPNSAASLTMNGSSVLVGQNSNLIYNGPNVSFAAGGAAVQTSQGMAAKFDHVAITPNQPSAKFRFQQNGSMLTVVAMEGSLSIVNGTKNLALNAGQQVDIDLNAKDARKAAGDEPGLSNAGTSGTGAGSPAPQGGSGGGASTLSTTGSALAASGAVIGVAIAGIIAVSQKAISPSGP